MVVVIFFSRECRKGTSDLPCWAGPVLPEGEDKSRRRERESLENTTPVSVVVVRLDETDGLAGIYELWAHRPGMGEGEDDDAGIGQRVRV